MRISPYIFLPARLVARRVSDRCWMAIAFKAGCASLSLARPSPARSVQTCALNWKP